MIRVRSLKLVISCEPPSQRNVWNPECCIAFLHQVARRTWISVTTIEKLDNNNTCTYILGNATDDIHRDRPWSVRKSVSCLFHLKEAGVSPFWSMADSPNISNTDREGYKYRHARPSLAHLSSSYPHLLPILVVTLYLSSTHLSFSATGFAHSLPGNRRSFTFPISTMVALGRPASGISLLTVFCIVSASTVLHAFAVPVRSHKQAVSPKAPAQYSPPVLPLPDHTAENHSHKAKGGDFTSKHERNNQSVSLLPFNEYTGFLNARHFISAISVGGPHYSSRMSMGLSL